MIIPGFLGGAGSFDQVARNTVRDAAQRGKDVEFRALDRRSNCLEDDRVRAHRSSAGALDGGPITPAFASWDFDNDPKTKKDAGYRQ